MNGETFLDKWSIDTSDAVRGVDRLEQATDKAEKAQGGFRSKLAQLSEGMGEAGDAAEPLLLGLNDLSTNLAGGVAGIATFVTAIGTGGLVGALTTAGVAAYTLYQNWDQLQESFFGEQAAKKIEETATPLEKLTETQAKLNEELEQLKDLQKADEEQTKRLIEVKEELAETEKKIEEENAKKLRKELADKIENAPSGRTQSDADLFKSRFGDLGAGVGDQVNAQREALAALTEAFKGDQDRAVQELEKAAQGNRAALQRVVKLLTEPNRVGDGNFAAVQIQKSWDGQAQAAAQANRDVTAKGVGAAVEAYARDRNIGPNLDEQKKYEEEQAARKAADQKRAADDKEFGLGILETEAQIDHIGDRRGTQRRALRRKRERLIAEGVEALGPAPEVEAPRIGGLGVSDDSDWSRFAGQASASLDGAAQAAAQRDGAAFNALSIIAKAAERQRTQSEAAAQQFKGLLERLRPGGPSLLGVL